MACSYSTTALSTHGFCSGQIISILQWYLCFRLFVIQPTMAVRASPPICSMSDCAPYLLLSDFPPAQNLCSIPFSERPVQVGDPKCSGGSDLCTLLTDLQAADPGFAQIVWYVVPLEPIIGADTQGIQLLYWPLPQARIDRDFSDHKSQT